MKQKLVRYFTLPNSVSISRLLFLVVIIWLWFSEGIFYDEIARILILILLFVIASLSDMLDGYLARRFKEKTEVGAFLDSLVDKCFTLSFFTVYLYVDIISVSWILVLLIMVREICITAMRIYYSMNNKVMITEKHGKWKVAFQMIFQGTIWLYLIFYAVIYESRLFQNYLVEKEITSVALVDFKFTVFAEFFRDVLGIKQFWISFLEFSPNYMLAFVTLFTLYSGVVYILKSRSLHS